MPFRPTEILFSSTSSCNLACPHCDGAQSSKRLPAAAARKFLTQCRSAGMRRVGFTGGEPFRDPAFLSAISAAAVEEGFLFSRIMTNGVWWRGARELERILRNVRGSGYDGEICVSVDAFHSPDMKKVSRFIETALSIWRRPDAVSLAVVTGSRDAVTDSRLSELARLLGGRIEGAGTAHAAIRGRERFIKILRIALAPVGKASRLKNPWDGKWFRCDRCKGPGNVLFVLPDGDVKPCCGYASDARTLTIGNIRRDRLGAIMERARKNAFVAAVFGAGLGGLRRRLERAGVRFPGKTSSQCFFCHHILTKLPATLLKSCLAAAILIMAAAFQSDADVLKTSKNFTQIPARAVRQVSVPQWYHEGMFFDGKNVWLCNGEEGKTWVIDPASGAVLSSIEPVAAFTEAITPKGDGTYYTTEWFEKKVYRVRLVDKALVPEAEVSVAPAHPAGVLWNGTNLYVVTWTRGLGTKFQLLVMDAEMKVVRTVRIRTIQEPDHLAWDGRYLWITSWFSQRVYKIDVDTMEAIGSFRSPAPKTTGIAWDGQSLWLTGTYADLYQMEIGE